jgi:hypothetical protein
MRNKAILVPILMLAGAATWLSAGEAEPDNRVAIAELAKVPVTFDGHVSKFEYSDVIPVRFPNGHGQVDAYVKAIDGYLYFAFELPDRSPHMGDDIVIMLDTRNDSGDAPQKDDIRAYVRRKSENSRMHKGDGKAWVNLYGQWEYRSTPYAVGWEVEARIPLKALDVDFSKGKTLGMAFRIWDNKPKKVHNWPVGSDERKPSTWGKLVFSSSKE